MSDSAATQRGSPCGSFAERSASPARPDPWLRRKFVVIIVLGIAVWSLYVGIGRVCVPAINEREGASYSRQTGIALLVLWLVLWLIFMWAYIMMITVGPGFAREVVPTSSGPGWKAPAAPYPMEQPNYQQQEATQNAWGPEMTQVQPAYQGHGHELPSFLSGKSANNAAHLSTYSSSTPSQPATMSPPGLPTAPMQPHTSTAHIDNTGPAPSAALPKPSRVPRPTPGVSTEPRWCEHCKIIKPDRTHHCRHCGTCILQFDHHCVWLGQCVGWRNHAIFITFCFWAGMMCLYNTVVLVVDMCLVFQIDGQKIAVTAISAIFFTFTFLMMLPTHVYLILVGRSTIESFQTGDQMRAEEAALKMEFNNPNCPTKEIRAVRKEWKAEYGGVAVNDRWRVGRLRDRWRREMGDRWIGWILPVGQPLGDGIHFPQNPRFGPHGEWLPMREWPPEVRATA